MISLNATDSQSVFMFVRAKHFNIWFNQSLKKVFFLANNLHLIYLIRLIKMSFILAENFKRLILIQNIFS